MTLEADVAHPRLTRSGTEVRNEIIPRLSVVLHLRMRRPSIGRSIQSKQRANADRVIETRVLAQGSCET